MITLKKTHLRYSKYNPTNIDWIGDIPDGWEARKLKYVSKSAFQYGANEAALDENPNNPRFVRITDIDEKWHLRPETFKSLEEDVAKDFLLRDGDILFARSGATVGKTFQYRPDWWKCCYAGYLIRMTVDENKASSDFIYYITKSAIYEGWKDSVFIKATIQNISAEKYKSFFVAIPSLEEQQKITAYLDEKTALLDEAIAKKRSQIDFLSEHRTALINNAITKGLDSNVEMKDSGVEWIGMIPKGWEVKKLKHWLRKLTDGSHTSVEILDDGLPYVTVNNIDERTESIDLSECKRISQKDYDFLVKNWCKPKIGDILFSQIGTIWLAVEVKEDDNFVMLSSLAILSPHRNEYNNRFLIHYLRSHSLSQQWKLLMSGWAVKRITLSHIRNFVAIFPSLEEQVKIVDYLDKETKYIDVMQAKIEQSIELLEEYKTSLISHAVSGKIKAS